MTWLQQLLMSLGGVAVLVSIAAFLSKKLVIHWLSKDLDVHKAKLEKISREHQIKFQQIYSQRQQALSALHKSIQDAVKLGYRALGSKGDPDVPKAVEAVNIAYEKISEYEIYLPRDFCDKWRQVLAQTHFSLSDLPSARAQRTGDLMEDRKQLAAVVDTCFEQLQKLNGEIADDFRDLIGVTDK
jgi:hypothetical protein